MWYIYGVTPCQTATSHHLPLRITGLYIQWHSQNMILAWAFYGHHSHARSLHGPCSHDTAIARSRHGSCTVTTWQLHGHDTAVHGHDTAVHGHDMVAQHARTSHGTGNSMHGSCTVMHAHSQKCTRMHGRPLIDGVSSKIIIIIV